MHHLTSEELYRLAEIRSLELTYDADDLDLLNHIEKCENCYQALRLALLVYEVTSPAGMSSLLPKQNEEELIAILREKGDALDAVQRLDKELGGIEYQR